MSKIDELVEAYHSAYSDCLIGTEDGLRARRAGIVAVVTALRDESGRRGYLNWDDLNQILGDAGNEKAAGGPTSNGGQAAQPAAYAPAAPTAAPAPTVGQRLIKAAKEAAAIARGADAADALQARAKEIERLVKERQSMQRWIDHHNDRADKAETEVERLTAALNEIAGYADDRPGDWAAMHARKALEEK